MPLLTALACPAKYNISVNIIEQDLTNEKPQWILSAYGPGRDAPEQLFGGIPREQSFEEVRFHYVVANQLGKGEESVRFVFPVAALDDPRR